MDRPRLELLLNRFADVSVLVVGDFFLDQYLVIDRRLAETSLETGQEAHQVVQVRCSPGAAGTVAANLRALKVNVLALGVTGDDGAGYELRRGLTQIGVDATRLIQCADLVTPTYVKPMLREASGFERELNRLDLKNRAPLPASVEQAIIAHLHTALANVHGVVIADQVAEVNCGVITDRVRARVCAEARVHAGKVFAADSRERVGLFSDVIVKTNALEAVQAVLPGQAHLDRATVEACARTLNSRAGRPVFVTLGPEGLLLCDRGVCAHFPVSPPAGPVDPVGAGDSVMAGVVSALCAGASLAEAATIGNLVAAVTIRQIGTTGTASAAQVLGQFESAS